MNTVRIVPWDHLAVGGADSLIAALGMAPHPEGGHYVETWRAPDRGDGRAAATAIYFLLRAGERSHWHRIDADEVWLFHRGSPLQLSIDTTEHILGPDRPQICVPSNAWQAARPTGEFTLMSCIVVPGFEFAGFELAPPGWAPG